MSFANVGRRWSTSSFPAWLATLKRPAWANSVCIHYTAAPSLAQRPSGFTAQHIENIRDFYKAEYGWNRGPHFFTDDDDIFGMTPPGIAGIHAASFNSRALGIEALGAYDTEDPRTGRGLAVMQTTAATARALFDWLEITPTAKNLLFHRFDPRTTKTCPGTKVHHDWFLELVLAAVPGVPHPMAEPDTGGLASVEYVPLVDYVSAKCGRKPAEITKLLRRDKDGLFYLGEQWIERARYDAATKTTLAPIDEADEAVGALLRIVPASAADERQPVVAVLATRLGISYKAAAARLKFDGGLFTWDGKPIAGAVFDRATQTTIAPAASLASL